MAQTAIRQLAEGTWARVYKSCGLVALLLAGLRDAEVKVCFPLIAYAWKLHFIICLSNIMLKLNGGIEFLTDTRTLIDYALYTLVRSKWVRNERCQ